ncbi:MAG: F(420)H(2) dehydrogenase subunit L [Methanomassiliicoccales archaeon PtaU1.Bin124]|nr:MAG: F(420)H(2) dehydrogenase subunit L [Methanomassiliicoccales archaeon PtaU1.Bin124]
MIEGGWLVLGLILVPAVAALVCLASMGRPVSRTFIWGTVVIFWALVLILAGLMLFQDVWRFNVPEAGLPDLNLLILVIDLALSLAFAYIGLRRKNWPILIMALLTFVLCLFLESQLHGGNVGYWVTVDRLSLLMLLITNLVGGAICIFSLKYMEHDAHQGRFFALMLLFIASMNGAVVSSNMLWLFCFWEATTFCSFALIAHDMSEKALKAAERALALTLLGALAFLLGLIALADITSNIDLFYLMSHQDLIPFFLLPLLMVAAFTKSAQVPFQSWLVGAMVAPTPVSALLHSATMVNLGVYLLMRIWPWYYLNESLTTMLLLVGGLTFLASSIMALRQSDAKRVLAYSTIGTLGLIFMTLGIGSIYGLTAAFLLLVSHAVAKAILFLSVGAIKHTSGSQDVEDMEGLLSDRRFLAYSIYLGVFLMILPPFGVFAGKLILLEAVTSQVLVAFLLVIGMASMTVYYGKWLGRTLVDRAVGPRPERTDPTFAMPLLFLAGMGLLLVVLTVPFIQMFVTSGTFTFMGRSILPLDSPWWELPTPGGMLPLYILLVVIAASFLLLTSWVRRPEEATTAYACGETMQIEIAGHYLYSERTETNVRTAFELIGIGLLLVLMIVPWMLEGIA